MKQTLLIAACALLLSPALSDAQIVVRIGPPPPRPVEVVPAPPPIHRDWAWRPGYHRWDGRAYVWEPGRWEVPPHAHASWVAPRWEHRNGGYVFVEGRWR